MKSIAIMAMIIAMFLTLDRVSSKCSSSEFLTERGHCCRNPKANYYITKNCTLESSSLAKRCRTCTGEAVKIIANCTRFSDTRCGSTVVGNETVNSTACPKCVLQVPPVNIFVLIAAVLLIGMLIVLFAALFSYHVRKGRKKAQFLKVPLQV